MNEEARFKYSDRPNMLLAFVVESVRDFVSDDDADAAVVERLGEVLAVEVRLQDSRREHWKKMGKMLIALDFQGT